MELFCEPNQCLFDADTADELTEGHIRGQYTWRPAANYSQFWGKTLREGMAQRLGTERPGDPVSDGVSSRSTGTFVVWSVSLQGKHTHTSIDVSRLNVT